MTEFYPVMLRLRGHICVIVGGGQVGARKAASLLDVDATVHLISPALHPALQKLVDECKITAQLMRYAPGALAKFHPALVFAATDDPAVNRQVAEEARSLGAWVDIADSGDDSNFLSMSSFRRGSVLVAVSTGGVSSTLAVHLREQLEHDIGDEYTILAGWIAEHKAIVREKIDSQARRSHLWKSIVESSILDELRRGDAVGARAVFERMIAEAIRDS
jgi:precorrin-2 dehydrogenase / sirohydrochlorin ferrochelatase